MKKRGLEVADRGPGLAEFPTTRWNVLLQARTIHPTSTALNHVCTVYWMPLYAYLRRSGIPSQDAEDLVQAFLGRLIEREDLSGVGPAKGRFRTYLLTSLRHHLLKDAERNRTLKRGGGLQFVPLAVSGSEADWAADLAAPTPEVAYDRRWARTVLDRAVARLRDEQLARGTVALFEAMAPFLDGAEPAAYESAAAPWGMSSGTFAVRVHRLRLRLRELVRAEVASTLRNPADVTDEMRHLFEAWQD